MIWCNLLEKVKKILKFLKKKYLGVTEYVSKKFKTNKKYDYVLIENALFNVKNPEILLMKLFNFVKVIIK